MLFLYFANPLVLLLLLLLPLLVWWHLRRGRRAVRFSASELLRGLPLGRSRLVRVAGLAFRVLALALLIIALAGPRWPDEGSRISTEGMSLALVLDVSFSMTDEDFLWEGQFISQLDAVKKVFKLFVQGGQAPDGQHFAGRNNDLLSLVVFAEYPQTVCPLTLDHAALVQILDKQDVRKQQWTNIGDSIVWALHSLEKAGKGKKAIILLTDGEQTKPGTLLKPRQAAQLAGNLGVPIYVIDPARDPADLTGARPEEIQNRQHSQQTMQDVANLSGGRYFKASDTKTLLEVQREIDELERQPIQSFQYRRFYQGFVWFALASFGFFATILFLELTFWRRVP